jgi:FtsP/CotA-like multicopper oxidase with cupredoxin domain
MVQEQKGVYGAFIIHPKKREIVYDKDVVVVLSDWSDENADQILKNLRKDGDYYLYKKDSIRSWQGALQANALGTYLKNEWTRMGGMDVSDVGYDAFLINGKRSSSILSAQAGQRVRVRIINAAASSYFYVSLGQETMNVISADGVDIEPVMAKELLMGMAETYDILFKVPENKNYELRATSQDITGYASGWIGTGSSKVEAPNKPQPNLYASMDHSAHAGHDMSTMDPNMDHSKMDMSDDEDIVQTLTVDKLKAKSKTAFPKSTPTYDLKLLLGGDMERYIWHMNGKTIDQDHVFQQQCHTFHKL